MADNDLRYQILVETQDAKKQVDFLTKSIKDLDTSTLKISQRNINMFTKQFAKAADPVKEAAETIKVLDSEISKIQKKIRETVATQGKSAARGLMSREQTLQNRRGAAIMAAQQSPEVASGIASATKQYNSLRKEIDKVSDSSKKAAGPLQKLLGRIKNISIYRAIRTGLKWITSGFREGLDNLAQYSDGVNKTMSNLNGSLNQIKNTMGIAFASVLQALEPVITALADGLVDVVNSFNLAMAKMSGQNVYTKAKKNVDDYAKSLQKAQKFSFDTFNVLSGGDGQTSPKDMFEEEEVSKDESALSGIFESLINVVKTLFEELKNIWDAIQPLLQPLLEAIQSLIKPISDIIIMLLPLITDLVKTAMPFIIDVIKGLSDIITQIAPILADVVKTLLPPIMELTRSVLTIIQALYPIFDLLVKTLLPPIAGALRIIAGLLQVVAGVLSFRWDQVSAGWNNITGGFKQAWGFADGGFTTANFIATNENGRREWVGRNANATAVVNDTQMSDIMYGAVRDGCYQGILQAMYDNGGGQSGNVGEIVLKVDQNVLGRVVAESIGFRNEVNRRNATLNLR